MPTVRIPVPLRSLTGDQATVSVDGGTAGEVLDALLAAHPDLTSEIMEGDGPKTSTYESINLMVGRRDMNELEGRATPVASDATLMLLRTWPAAISGGKQFNQPIGAEPPE
jgi:hypothetical protein